MQISIQVPDNLPLQRINQRIRELEENLKAEAKFINELSQQTKVGETKTTNLTDLLLAMPNVGKDDDFARQQNLEREKLLTNSIETTTKQRSALEIIAQATFILKC